MTEQNQSTSWQPIATAPRDGSEVVARAVPDDLWIVTWRSDTRQWQIKKPVGRDPVLYIDVTEWLPMS